MVANTPAASCATAYFQTAQGLPWDGSQVTIGIESSRIRRTAEGVADGISTTFDPITTFTLTEGVAGRWTTSQTPLEVKCAIAARDNGSTFRFMTLIVRPNPGPGGVNLPTLVSSITVGKDVQPIPTLNAKFAATFDSGQVTITGSGFLAGQAFAFVDNKEAVLETNSDGVAIITNVAPGSDIQLAVGCETIPLGKVGVPNAQQ